MIVFQILTFGDIYKVWEHLEKKLQFRDFWFLSACQLLLTLFRLGGGAFDATLDLNPLLVTNDCLFSIPTSRLFLRFTWEQFGVVRF